MTASSSPQAAFAAAGGEQAALFVRLTQAKLRPTRARLALLALLDQPSQLPMDAEAIYQALSTQDRRASLGTVYRILKELEQSQVLVREFDQDGRSLYMIWRPESQVQAVHLACRSTGRTFLFSDPALRERLAEVLLERGLSLGDAPVFVQITSQAATPAARKTPRGVGVA
ncbi:transcriptional repressor [Comamonadaceae bacterium PP-2]